MQNEKQRQQYTAGPTGWWEVWKANEGKCLENCILSANINFSCRTKATTEKDSKRERGREEEVASGKWQQLLLHPVVVALLSLLFVSCNSNVRAQNILLKCIPQ